MIGAIIIPTYIFFLPNVPLSSEKSTTERLINVDWTGWIILSSILTTFLTGITFGGVSYSWASPRVTVLLVVAGLNALLFVFQQHKTRRTCKEKRIFPVALLHSGTQILLFILTGITTSPLITHIINHALFSMFICRRVRANLLPPTVLSVNKGSLTSCLIEH